jgi:hypothetical protein
MNKIVLIFSLGILISSCSNKDKEQPEKTELKKEVSQSNKDDRLNLYNSEKINSVDLLEAFDFIGVQIHKFEIGEFNKRRDLILLMKEFENGILKTTDTLTTTDNQFYESFDENGSPNMGFIDQIKILTKTDNEKSELVVKTYRGQSAKRSVALNKVDDNQFFLWRVYEETKWKTDKEVPLMIFASSWYDERINNHRFCGVAKLTEKTEATDELLKNSPNYLLISYKVTE